MKNNLRGKIREFIASEEGRVGIKGPLTLGVPQAASYLHRQSSEILLKPVHV